MPKTGHLPELAVPTKESGQAPLPSGMGVKAWSPNRATKYPDQCRFCAYRAE
jgi:hypothetical protein